MLFVGDVERGDAASVLRDEFRVALLGEDSSCDVDESLNFVVIFVVEHECVEIVAIVDGGLYSFAFVERAQVVPPSGFSCDVSKGAPGASDVFRRCVVCGVIGGLANFFEGDFGVVPLSQGASDIVE